MVVVWAAWADQVQDSDRSMEMEEKEVVEGLDLVQAVAWDCAAVGSQGLSEASTVP